MKEQTGNSDPWSYASFDGAERLQAEQVARMSLSERLHVLDEMIGMAIGLQGDAAMIRESQPSYGKFAK